MMIRQGSKERETIGQERKRVKRKRKRRGLEDVIDRTKRSKVKSKDRDWLRVPCSVNRTYSLFLLSTAILPCLISLSFFSDPGFADFSLSRFCVLSFVAMELLIRGKFPSGSSNLQLSTASLLSFLQGLIISAERGCTQGELSQPTRTFSLSLALDQQEEKHLRRKQLSIFSDPIVRVRGGSGAGDRKELGGALLKVKSLLFLDSSGFGMKRAREPEWNLYQKGGSLQGIGGQDPDSEGFAWGAYQAILLPLPAAHELWESPLWIVSRSCLPERHGSNDSPTCELKFPSYPQSVLPMVKNGKEDKEPLYLVMQLFLSLEQDQDRFDDLTNFSKRSVRTKRSEVKERRTKQSLLARQIILAKAKEAHVPLLHGYALSLFPDLLPRQKLCADLRMSLLFEANRLLGFDVLRFVCWDSEFIQLKQKLLARVYEVKEVSIHEQMHQLHTHLTVKRIGEPTDDAYSFEYMIQSCHFNSQLTTTLSDPQHAFFDIRFTQFQYIRQDRPLSQRRKASHHIERVEKWARQKYDAIDAHPLPLADPGLES
ncbi:zinc transport protein ZntB [Striga asiatica]|uniref:Zinc transport protein ZntB n=1 Tax=Striga asiatica TaxID=4170 RepID=A0A5A7Q1G4_STRAF|nr:zinc transport protein ZntB [Striga asiatica]